MASNNVTIKIPEVMNPFLVVVNGKEYSYPAGQEVAVPEEVAEVIQNYQEQLPKPDPISGAGGGAGGMVTLYNEWPYLNKSADFGEENRASKAEIFSYVENGGFVIAQ